MKRSRKALAILALAAVTSVAGVLSGCTWIDDATKSGTEYTVNYILDGDTKTMKIKHNDKFTISDKPSVPVGREFAGWTREGELITDSNGVALEKYKGSGERTFKAKFTPKAYTVELKYGDAARGDKPESVTVSYGDKVTGLPTDLAAEHKVFDGWYTEDNGKGVCVCTKSGMIGDAETFDENTYKLFDADGKVELYAHFSAQTMEVTCDFGDAAAKEKVYVPYGASVSAVMPATRVGGLAPYKYSKTSGGEAYTGTITDATTLYVTEYAPAIVFDGADVPAIVKKAGEAVTLPAPTRDDAEFAGWKTSTGEDAEITAMPTESVKLTADWNVVLKLDKNGGSECADIKAKPGAAITLPQPDRDGYIFGGWYYSGTGRAFTATSMPTEGASLKAGWYKKYNGTVTILSASSEQKITNEEVTIYKDWNIHISQLPEDFKGMVKISASWQEKSTNGKDEDTNRVYVGFYSRRDTDTQYRLCYANTRHDKSTDYKRVEVKSNAVLESNRIYIGYTAVYRRNLLSSWGYDYFGYLKDFKVSIDYPFADVLFM